MKHFWLSILIVACAFFDCTPLAFAQPGETAWELRGTDWKQTDADGSLQGILVKPLGDGPFPALILSHGLGGTAAGLRGRAQAFALAGFVCIATDYTHSGQGKAGQPSNGSSPENIRRAGVCLKILQGLDYVDKEHIGAWGFSMGALLTIGLAAERGDQLYAAAISAGGVREGSTTLYPSTAAAAKIRTPMCLVHGANDERVSVESSALLADILKQNGVNFERHLFDGVSHVAVTRHDEANQKILDWFTNLAGMDQARFALQRNEGGDRQRGNDSRTETPSATQRRPQISFVQIARRHDANQDNKVTRDEFSGPAPIFSRFDSNGDGVITPDDFSESDRATSSREAAPNNRATPTDSAASWVDPDQNAPEPTHYKTFLSKTIGGDVSYLIYLPPSYETDSDQRYPVIYWLHGMNGSQRGGAGVARQLDTAIRAGKAPEMIMVLINGMKRSSYVNSADGSLPMESVIISDLIPHIDQTYRTIADRSSRAVEGFSMGGAGAIKLGFRNLDQFGLVTSVSGALHSAETIAARRGGEIFNKVYGGSTEYYHECSPWKLAPKHADRLRADTKIRIIIGESDGLFETNSQYHELLHELGIPHEFRTIPDAGHSHGVVYSSLGDDAWEFYSVLR